MRAITLEPGVTDSADLEEMPEPGPSEGSILVDGVALGICGTDAEIVHGDYGEAPPGAERLILGHESLGRVAEAPAGSGFAPGDLLVGLVRRPDPEPCPSCAAGEWDFCRNGRYTERGIKALHGFGSERWRIEPEFAVKLDPSLGLLGVLMEPTTIVAKAWEQIDRIAQRATIAPQRVLVTGAGPIGLLAALLARQRGLEVHVLDRATDGPKPELVRDLGGRYFTGGVKDLDPRADVIV
ncbi:MAG: alcohol dehydrogenase catalytic domain-containing protein, partial [Solirubrobacteraceae bacterium]